MAFGVDESIYEPKLSFSKLPAERLSGPLQVPPFCSPVSIPFHWEEAPGRPRATTETPPSSAPLRRLDLPPGFLPGGTKFTIIPSSPAAVLDGPYVRRSLSLARSFSFRTGSSADGRKVIGGSARWEAGKLAWGNLDVSYPPPRTAKRRRSSFLRFSSINFNIWGGIYGSFKQAVAVHRSRRRAVPNVN